ncbi:3'-5' exonuclease [Mycoplasma sp. 1012]
METLNKQIFEEKRLDILKSKKLPNLFKDSYVIFDLEGCDDVGTLLEIGAIKVKNNKIVDTFSKIIKQPPDFVNNFISWYNNISNKEIKEKGEDAIKVLSEFKIFIEDLNLYAFNGMHYDFRTIKKSYKSRELEKLPNKMIDIGFYFQSFNKVFFNTDSYSLNFLSNLFSVDNQGIHRALKDCIITFEVYNKTLVFEELINAKERLENAIVNNREDKELKEWKRKYFLNKCIFDYKQCIICGKKLIQKYIGWGCIDYVWDYKLKKSVGKCNFFIKNVKWEKIKNKEQEMDTMISLSVEVLSTKSYMQFEDIFTFVKNKLQKKWFEKGEFTHEEKELVLQKKRGELYRLLTVTSDFERLNDGTWKLKGN